jgi:phytoene synthase
MPETSFIESAAAYCRKLTTQSRSNFYYAFLFLPKERREALEAVYAYCRLVDDVVDEDATVAQKLAGIEKWQCELDAVYGEAKGASREGELEPSEARAQGRTPGGPAPIGDVPSAHPVTRRLRTAIERGFAIRRQDMEAVIDGCAMDIEKTRYANWDELRLYCYRVASAVGLMCIEIFGYSPTHTDAVQRYAVDLGIALQLTNILRDVGEDARRGRIYLPADEMAQHGVSEADILEGRRTPAFLRMMRFLAGRARAHYLRARAALPQAEKHRLVIAEIMGDIYYTLLQEIEARGFDVFAEKATVRRRDKMRIALGLFARAKLSQLTA